MSAVPETTKITDPGATQVLNQPAAVEAAPAPAAQPAKAASGPAVTFLGTPPATLAPTSTGSMIGSDGSRGKLLAVVFGGALLAALCYFGLNAASSDGRSDDDQAAETIKDEAAADAATFAPSTPDKEEAEAPPAVPTDPDDPATPKAVKAAAPAPTPSMLQKPEAATVKLASPSSPTIAAAASAEPTMYFATNKAQLSKETKQALDLWAVRLKHNRRMTLTLEGHCDERGTVKYNQKLGAARAKAAKAYLVAKGIQARRLYTVSYGKSRPVAKGHGESAWSQNRRVELKSAGKALVRR